MENALVGIALAHLFLFVVAMTFVTVAHLRRWRWRPQYAAGIYFVLLMPALVLFRGVAGDRALALVSLLPAVVGLSLLVADRPGGGRRP